MPKIYPRQLKRHALYLMEELGSVRAVSQQLGIPERTLRHWRLHERLEPQPDPALAFQPTNDDTPGPRRIRDRLIQQLEHLTHTFPKDDARAAYYATLAIDRLLNQIDRLTHLVGLDDTTRQTVATLNQADHPTPETDYELLKDDPNYIVIHREEYKRLQAQLDASLLKLNQYVARQEQNHKQD